MQVTTKRNITPKPGSVITRKVESSKIREVLEARREVMAHSDGREYSQQVAELLQGRYTEQQIDEIVWSRGLECETAVTLIETTIPQTIQWAKVEGWKSAHE